MIFCVIGASVYSEFNRRGKMQEDYLVYDKFLSCLSLTLVCKSSFSVVESTYSFKISSSQPHSKNEMPSGKKDVSCLH